MEARKLLLVLLVLVAVLTASLIVDAVLRLMVRKRRRIGARGRSLVVPAAAVLVAGGAGTALPSPAVSVPASTLVSPAVAAAVLNTVLNMRRDQRSLAGGEVPCRLAEEDMRTLASLVQTAAACSQSSMSELLQPAHLPSDVKSLLERVGTTETKPTDSLSGEWLVMVRVLGEPTAVNQAANKANFGKRKSLELLTWMALNRDRSTRSAARNALWDVSVADSTFSTVLSDMRRGLTRVAPLPADKCWSPATYTDELPLADKLTTDVDALWSAIHSQNRDELLGSLSLVRDFPFAGTAWLWPDLDGSTTRGVIAVLQAVRLSLECPGGDLSPNEMSQVLRAGLLVSPGDEDLLDRSRALGIPAGSCTARDSRSLS